MGGTIPEVYGRCFPILSTSKLSFNRVSTPLLSTPLLSTPLLCFRRLSKLSNQSLPRHLLLT